MLTDKVEIEIISKAVQVNVRDPKRTRKPFFKIKNDFFTNININEKKFLDLGPGQFDFGVVINQHFTVRVDAIDNDPAVAKLGEHKGFKVFLEDLQDLSSFINSNKNEYDGLFCKYSINAFWMKTPEEVYKKTCELLTLLKDEGWSWIAPWNGHHQNFSSDEIEGFLDAQKKAFADNGFSYLELTKRESIRYGVHGVTANRPIFYKNLHFKKKSFFNFFS